MSAGALKRMEEAGFNAWPALQTVLLDGWVLRFANGYTKRANSVNPLYPGAQEDDLSAKILACERLYARQGLPCIFRLTSFGTPDGLDALLANRGYLVQDPTKVMSVALNSVTTAGKAGCALVQDSLDDWLPRYARWNGANPAGQGTHAEMLRRITGETLYATLLDEVGQPVALGLGVREGAVFGLFDIVTDPGRRREGYGRALVEAMLGWAAAADAATAYLQVVAANYPARALYETLGFTIAYDYWYRLPPPA